MANQWLRLWHDMPTDPKWRTIARASGERIGDVMAVYCHLLVCASNATERGRTQSFNSEDVANALDIQTEQVERIIDAMQRRVLDGDMVAGWEKRQVAREDGAAERAKAWREAQKQTKQTQSNAGERKQTPDKDTDKDTDKKKQPSVVARATRKCPESFVVTEIMVAWAAKNTPGIDVNSSTDKFRDHTFKNAITDWDGAWRNWMRTDQERIRPAHGVVGKQAALEAKNAEVAQIWAGSI